MNLYFTHKYSLPDEIEVEKFEHNHFHKYRAKFRYAEILVGSERYRIEGSADGKWTLTETPLREIQFTATPIPNLAEFNKDSILLYESQVEDDLSIFQTKEHVLEYVTQNLQNIKWNRLLEGE